MILVIVGAINWGLVGIGGYNWDLVAMILGGVDGIIAKIVYILVGLSGIMMIFKAKGCHCKSCGKGGSAPMPESNPGM